MTRETDRQAVFTAATDGDADELGRLMRDADRRECAAMHGMTAIEAARLSLAVSDVAFAARIGGRLQCLFGASRESIADSSAVAWMLCTTEPERRPRDFLSNCGAGLRLLAGALPDVDLWTNAVGSDNASAIAWLEWAGAWFSTEPPTRGSFGGTFRRFSMLAAGQKGPEKCAR